MHTDHSEAAEESREERRRKKRAELMAEDRQMEPWERYRALSDMVDHNLDLIEMADRRTRFALIILGALNALNLVLAMQSERLGVGTINILFVQLYAAAYVLLSLYFFVHAIEALRPRSRQMGRTSDANTTHTLPGLRLIDDIIAGSGDAYYERWQGTEIGQLNRELALQAYMMARTASIKFQGLYKVYQGLKVLVVLTGGLVLLITLRLVLARLM